MNKPIRDWTAHPPFLVPDYRSTQLRAPTHPLIPIAPGLSERTGPIYTSADVGKLDADMTKNGAHDGVPLGERIVVAGTVHDDRGRPVPNTVIELWQANAAGRYIDNADNHDAPIDPNFFGGGRCVTDDEGRYRFTTIKPGAYPWGNHDNGWRPAHIHFSLFGAQFSSRLITQMYFPGDPLLALDPIFMATPAHARNLLVAQFDLAVTTPMYALGYRFDLVLAGRDATPTDR